MGHPKMVVTGAGGMVGSYVAEVFAGTELTLTDVQGGLTFLDVTDPKAVREAIEGARPDVVLHLAAATDVDACEQDPDFGYRINAVGTQNVALACQSTGAVMVYVSSGAVFPGDKKEPYSEFDETGPVNLYGRSKLIGERMVANLLSRYYIVRSGWMIGGGAQDKKFVGKIVRKIRAGEKHLQVVDDKLGSTTYARDFLQGVRQLIDTGQYGLFHMVNPGMQSRYHVALAIREILGAGDVEIEPISSARFPLPAPRGESEALRNGMLDLLGWNHMRPYEEALADYIRTQLMAEA